MFEVFDVTQVPQGASAADNVQVSLSEAFQFRDALPDSEVEGGAASPSWSFCPKTTATTKAEECGDWRFLNHLQILRRLNSLFPDATEAAVGGRRCLPLRGLGALLHEALTRLFSDCARRANFEQVLVPLLAR